LMATGYEQVRSIAAALAGDQQAADDVHLVLPETGVCTTDLGGTCDTPAPATPATTHQGCCTPANPAPVPPPTPMATRRRSARRPRPMMLHPSQRCTGAAPHPSGYLLLIRRQHDLHRSGHSNRYLAPKAPPLLRLVCGLAPHRRYEDRFKSRTGRSKNGRFA